ncbi:GNAT family N-acetyltransferase [Microlunatus sp. Gsoil 973]|jgi:predicted GNAT superfamily acetyltransferase|uniref:GNAT family N-acetyltransferase n=1 Tax=Microlunatus sp. Gsoil 973 TaxID=2672569 RepID=UPI0012B4A8C8|nr:GNAT family N-acetyltransferase [Microlunatus sp. Gsoil 973]QGN32280.1 GNAT family N-acetyltransferase [Microlunatus sp. Gsoil 973]
MTIIEPAEQVGSDYRVISLETAEQRRDAAELYRSVFGYAHPAYGVNPRLLAGIAANGGSVVGALDRDDRLVGFAYGFLGTDGKQTFHYSQAAVVAPGLQGHGLGRRLKQAQRAVALSWGTTVMRWAYDPLLIRNAHFNLDVLGARGVDFKPDLYDERDTDRIVVEWDLTGGDPRRTERADLPDAGVWGEVIRPGITSTGFITNSSDIDGGRVLLALPSDIATLRRERPDRAAELAAIVRDRLTGLFADGYHAVSCHSVGETAFYVFDIWSQADAR